MATDPGSIDDRATPTLEAAGCCDGTGSGRRELLPGRVDAVGEFDSGSGATDARAALSPAPSWTVTVPCFAAGETSVARMGAGGWTLTAANGFAVAETVLAPKAPVPTAVRTTAGTTNFQLIGMQMASPHPTRTLQYFVHVASAHRDRTVNPLKPSTVDSPRHSPFTAVALAEYNSALDGIQVGCDRTGP